MILSAHQPAYLPWLGYFDKIIKSDVFIFLDSVQFEKNSFTNRNKIKTPKGPLWLTVPVKTKGHLSCILAELEIDNAQNWRQKHFKSILQNYNKGLFFNLFRPKLESLYNKEYRYLVDLCWDQLMFWLHELGIERKIVRSSQLPVRSKKSDLVLNLCEYFGADQYLSGALGRNYLNEADFHQAGITLKYQQYQHPVYPQLWGDFFPFMGIIDFWMNTQEYSLISGPDHP